MTSNEMTFILAGNGSYANRGCEAITRGTVKILKESFTNPEFICLSHFPNDDQFKQQIYHEYDEKIIHLKSFQLSKRRALKLFWRPSTWSYAYHFLFKKSLLKYDTYREMYSYLNESRAVLSIGGDNYSLDYGIPSLFTNLDDIVIESKKPLVIWGASVGPFNQFVDYEKYMISHLRNVTCIFSRESYTTAYLNKIGVIDNVYQTSDPAFLMDSVKPIAVDDIIAIEDDSIGVNLSPLMANYITNGDLDTWIEISASFIRKIHQQLERPIYLIPHVTDPLSNDYTFLMQVANKLKDIDKDIFIVPPIYSAAELKWIISRMSIFAGARTHSTIASLSSFIPTISFTYSMKGKGINKDIFQHTDYCIDSTEFDADTTAQKITTIWDDQSAIRKELNENIPQIKRIALQAGSKLKEII